MSAGFNAPIAGVIYALEVGGREKKEEGEVDNKEDYNKLITMFLCSISASLVTHFGLGNDLGEGREERHLVNYCLTDLHSFLTKQIESRFAAFNTPASVINSLDLSFGEVIDFSVIGCLCGLGAFLLEQSEEAVKKVRVRA